MVFFGSKEGHLTRIMKVDADGYIVGLIKHKSMSAAAEAAGAPKRKSGWRFWKLPDGRSAKEVYRSYGGDNGEEKEEQEIQ